MIRGKKSRLAHRPAIIIRRLLIKLTQQIEALLGRFRSIGFALEIRLAIRVAFQVPWIILLCHILLDIVDFLLIEFIFL